MVSRFRWRLQGRSTGRVGKVGWPVVVALLRLHLALRSAAPKAAHRNRNERRRACGRTRKSLAIIIMACHGLGIIFMTV